MNMIPARAIPVMETIIKKVLFFTFSKLGS
jgi:hypothetical protein